MRILSRLAPLALLALAFLPLACGGDDGAPARTTGGATASSDASEPQAVVQRFLEAVQGGDETAFANSLTERALEAMESGDGFSLNGQNLESFEIGATSVDGDSASVEVTMIESGDSRESDLLLRRETAGWRVYGMRVQFGDGSFTIDLEELGNVVTEIGEGLAEEIGEEMQKAFAEAQETWQQGGTLEQIAARREAFEAVAAVTREEHEAAWRISVSGAGRPVATVIEELAARAGLAIDAGAHAAALAAPVDLELEGVSRVEAIERLAWAAGVHPVWPSPTPAGWGDETEPEPLTFAAGPRTLPATFAGPFLVEVASVEEDAPNTVGKARIAMRALGLAPEILAFQDDSGEFLFVERVRTAGDEPLTDETMRHLGTPEVRGGYFSYSIDKDLRGLLGTVDSIATIAGTVSLPIPARVEPIEWTRGDEAPKTVSMGTLTVSSWGEQTQFALAGTADLDAVQVRMGPRKASGDPLGVLFSSSNGWGQSLQASLQCPDSPAAIDLKVCTVETITLPFELGPVPLARHAEQPLALEELAFDGHAPVTVEVIHDGGGTSETREVGLRIENRSNKDATRVSIEFVYTSAAGEWLDDFPYGFTGDYDFETERWGPVAAAGATIRQDASAPFVPEGTATVRARLTSVEFPDGTSWEAEE